MEHQTPRPSWTTPILNGRTVERPHTTAQPLSSRQKLTLVTGLLLGGCTLACALHRGGAPAPPAPMQGIAQRTFNGPNGQVTLHDWPDGRRWLGWYQTNQDWVGAPLWADRLWHDEASCTAFVRAIVCLNLNPKTAGTAWHLLAQRLGSQVMLEAALQPMNGAQPAPLIASYLVSLQQRGVDTLARYGLPQSPVLTMGTSQQQYFERVLFEWPVGCQTGSCVQLAPLGQLAVSHGW